jgi:hypothetical protein
VVERALDGGLLAAGASLTHEHVSVRSIGDGAVETWRGGVVAQDVGSTRASLDVSASTIADSAATGIAVIGSDAWIRNALVQRSVPSAAGAGGIGLLVRDARDDGARAVTTMQTSLVEDHAVAAAQVEGSDLVLEAVLARASESAAAGAHGAGVVVQPSPDSGARALAAVRASTIERARGVGLLVLASDAQVDDTEITDTGPRTSDGAMGDGVAAVSASAGAPTLAIARGRIEKSARAGISTFGAAVSLDEAQLVCNAIDLATAAGSGGSFMGVEGSSCGCEAMATCAVTERALDPPGP